MAIPKSAVFSVYILGGVMLVIAGLLAGAGRYTMATVTASMSAVMFGLGVSVLASQKPKDAPRN